MSYIIPNDSLLAKKLAKQRLSPNSELEVVVEINDSISQVAAKNQVNG
jgi:hypothetical protein